MTTQGFASKPKLHCQPGLAGVGKKLESECPLPRPNSFWQTEGILRTQRTQYPLIQESTLNHIRLGPGRSGQRFLFGFLYSPPLNPLPTDPHPPKPPSWGGGCHVSFGKCCQGVFVLLACCMCCSFGLLCFGVCLSLSLSLSLSLFLFSLLFSLRELGPFFWRIMPQVGLASRSCLEMLG